MPILNWISDESLYTAVNNLLIKSKEAVGDGEKKFEKNVIDPFSAVFTMTGFNIDFNAWYKVELTRQSQKTLQNHVGKFHQDILGSVGNWEDLNTGNIVDIVSEEKRILAEIKNKYNTISGGKLSDLYYVLDSLVMPKNSNYKGFTAYYVSIIPRKNIRFDKPFTPSIGGRGERCPENPLIRVIDGASFYDLVTGEKNSLLQLFNALPFVIKECTDGNYIFKDFERLKYYFNLAFESLE